MHQQYQKQGLVVIGVAVDPKEEPVKKLVEAKKVPYAIVADTQHTVTKAYGVSVPSGLFLIDKKGTV